MSEWARRTFVKAALAGAASTLVSAKREAPTQEKGHESDLTELSLEEVSRRVRSRKVSPVELTEACLRRIEHVNPDLNAFITVTGEAALAQAREAEAEIGRGHCKGPLHGVPIALKDLVDTAGVRTTAASALFKDRVPSQDAEIVRRLKAAGAVLLGKLNLHEFAYGGSSVISHFGPIRNPWARDYSPGGSSGGSGAAVAAGLCYGAIGTDTGGSIRLPAAYCGIVGLKPTYGRVSGRGVIPLSWSLDHVGPMTRTVSDAALMLQVLAGYDLEDPASVDIPVPDYAAELARPTAVRIGVPRAYFHESLNPEIQASIEAAIAVLHRWSSSEHELEIPASSDATVLRVEALAYHQEFIAKSPELYQPETLRRIRAASEITGATYVMKRREQDQLRRSIRKTFDSVDVLVTPTAPVPPFKIAELLGDPENLRSKEVLTLRNTRPFNTLGLPTISLPCGFTSAGLPIGMQLSGPPGGEATVLRLARAYERETEWHTHRPSLS